MRLIYHRQSRTMTSEQYQVFDGERRLGHLDLHYGQSDVAATLVLDDEMDEDQVAQLIEQIDEELVLTSDMPRDREDFLVRVFVGRELGLYSEDLLRDNLEPAYVDGNGAFEEE
jgi:hypothetical protein